MQKFSVPVDLRSRQDMINYLQNHFRYDTMNSWNRADSYACNLKIYKLGLSSEIESKLYDLLDTEEFFLFRRELMQAFDEAHQYRWQVGMNGRSGGYLVLYEGELTPTGHKSYCTKCGQRNYKSVLESGNICGKCRLPARVDFQKTPMRAVTFPGRGVDMNEKFDTWSLESLRDRVRLIQELDALADEMVLQAIYLAKHYEFMEVEVSVPKTEKVLVAV